MDYLIFRLYGAMASWGEIAIGESRQSSSYPSKSAILGLLAAALGIRREEETAHKRLGEICRIAVKQVSAGNSMQDYHTTQVPDSVGKFHYRTRRDEVVAGHSRLGTVLSTREYRCGAIAWVAVRLESSDSWRLSDMQAALLKPRFHLYLGRKSCPLAAPMEPKILQGAGFREVFSQFTCSDLSPYKLIGGNTKPVYFWEGEVSDFDSQLEARHVQTLTRHDEPLSRKRWQFKQRLEHCYLEGEAG
ncbi:MAG: type I-E CRISPR-associated protein Cas5/CasD [Exilibacterium sp.]